MCIWDPHIHERVRDLTYMRGAETERKNLVYIHSEPGKLGLPGSKVMCKTIRTEASN